MSNGITPQQRAALNTIRMAEGTYHGGSERGYGTMFGGGQFDWRKGHPDRVVRSGGYASAAAGAYQFMPRTWAGAAKALGLKDFSPESQDRAAIYLAQRRGVDLNRPLDAAALNKLAPEWASLPTTSGKSYYGQPVKAHRELQAFYSSQLRDLSGQGAAAAPGRQAGGAPAPAQAPAPNPGNGLETAPPMAVADAGLELMPRRSDGDQLLNAIRQTGEMAASIGSSINNTLGQSGRMVGRGLMPVQAAISSFSRPAATRAVLGQVRSRMPRPIPGIRVPGLTVPGFTAPTAALRRLISIGELG